MYLFEPLEIFFTQLFNQLPKSHKAFCVAVAKSKIDMLKDKKFDQRPGLAHLD